MEQGQVDKTGFQGQDKWVHCILAISHSDTKLNFHIEHIQGHTTSIWTRIKTPFP